MFHKLFSRKDSPDYLTAPVYI